MRRQPVHARIRRWRLSLTQIWWRWPSPAQIGADPVVVAPARGAVARLDGSAGAVAARDDEKLRWHACAAAGVAGDAAARRRRRRRRERRRAILGLGLGFYFILFFCACGRYKLTRRDSRLSRAVHLTYVVRPPHVKILIFFRPLGVDGCYLRTEK